MLQCDSKQVTQQTATATPVCKNLCCCSNVISQSRSCLTALTRVELRKLKETSQLKRSLVKLSKCHYCTTQMLFNNEMCTATLHGVCLWCEHTLSTAFRFFLSFDSLSCLLVTSLEGWFYALRTELPYLESGWYQCLAGHNQSVHCWHVQFSYTNCILTCFPTRGIFISLFMFDLLTMSAVQIV